MYTKKKKIVITVAVIVLIIFSMIYFSVDAKRLGEISGYYTGVDLKKDGTETSDDDDDSNIVAESTRDRFWICSFYW